jgi:hypothetical protein
VVGEGDGEGDGVLDGGLDGGLVGGPVTLVSVVPEVLVAVLSLGMVMTSVTAAEVSKVMGTKTVALVVGGSRVSVMV